MAFCQSLNKKVKPSATKVDRLMPVFRRHHFGEDNVCTRCYAEKFSTVQSTDSIEVNTLNEVDTTSGNAIASSNQ